MCGICKGTNVKHEIVDSGYTFEPCPVCGPQTKEEHDREFAELYKKLDEAEALYKKEKTA
ncbi:hypothetical protein ACFFGV_19690 [Pontibacillus salicampi]|uniref:Uncharacterized protein n=1 Tax=Pontibacillus salicampi TaxID=1449801 RepID=A0ABV6LTS1_9BACI